MKKLLIILLFCMTFGCSKSSNDDPNTINIDDVSIFLEKLSSASSVNILKENLPEWLVVRINDYYETRSPLICKVQIYKGEWNKQTVYFIMDTFSACYMCDFFTGDGGKIVDNLSDCRATSQNWILIYKFGEL
jgi:hypothetical protein